MKLKIIVFNKLISNKKILLMNLIKKYLIILLLIISNILKIINYNKIYNHCNNINWVIFNKLYNNILMMKLN
jgi:hypothetical protein